MKGEGSATPILSALRALLKFKSDCTIAEIAKMSGATQRHVLDTLNENSAMVWRHQKTGRITRVDPRGVLEKGLWESGAFFRTSDGNIHPQDTPRPEIVFKAHDALKKEMIRPVGGWYGNSDIVPDTPENRQKLRDAGCVPVSEIGINDRLWKEHPEPRR